MVRIKSKEHKDTITIHIKGRNQSLIEYLAVLDKLMQVFHDDYDMGSKDVFKNLVEYKAMTKESD